MASIDTNSLAYFAVVVANRFPEAMAAINVGHLHESRALWPLPNVGNFQGELSPHEKRADN